MNKQTMTYTERHEKFPDRVIISHPHNIGGNRKDAYMWMAEWQGEVWDYGTRDYLIAAAKAEKKSYVVLRFHRNGNASVIDESNVS